VGVAGSLAIGVRRNSTARVPAAVSSTVVLAEGSGAVCWRTVVWERDTDHGRISGIASGVVLANVGGILGRNPSVATTMATDAAGWEYFRTTKWRWWLGGIGSTSGSCCRESEYGIEFS